MKLYQDGDGDAFPELMRRYVSLSKKEAGALLRLYKDVTNAEFDDLVQIGLHSLLIAIDTYSFIGGFFYYWQPIARHNMLKHIQEFSLSYTHIYPDRDEADCFEGVLASPDDEASEVSASIDVECIKRILNNSERYNIPEIDATLFYYHYFMNFDIDTLARLSDLQYFTVRRKIERTKEKLAFILNNSKE